MLRTSLESIGCEVSCQLVVVVPHLYRESCNSLALATDAMGWRPYSLLMHRPSERLSEPISLQLLHSVDFLMIRASSVVRYSEHCGIEVFCNKSYSDLQSTIANALGICEYTCSGFCQFSEGHISHAQWMRNHPSKSTAPDRAYVSEAKVLPTTRLIFLEYQASALIGAETS